MDTLKLRKISLFSAHFWVCLFVISLITTPLAEAKERRSIGFDYHGETEVTLNQGRVSDQRNNTSVMMKSVKVRWRIWTLAGQPVKTFVANYQLAPNSVIMSPRVLVCNPQSGEVRYQRSAFRLPNSAAKVSPSVAILSTSTFRAHIRSRVSEQYAWMGYKRLYIDFSPDSMVPAFRGFGISAPGSPNWDGFFKRSTFGRESYVGATEAKEIMRRGIEIERIELISARLDISKALLQHNQRVRESCKKPEQEKPKPSKNAPLSTRQNSASSEKKQPELNSDLSRSLNEQLRQVSQKQADERLQKELSKFDERAEALHKKANDERQACKTQGPKRPYSPIGLSLVQQCVGSNCQWQKPTAAEIRARERREEEARAARRAVAKYEADRKAWVQVGYPACLKAADDRLQAGLGQLKREREQHLQFIQSTLPNLGNNLIKR